MDSQTQPTRAHIRKRRALACEPCRQSKLRCDRNHPCSNCLRSKNKQCSYQYPTAQQRRLGEVASLETVTQAPVAQDDSSGVVAPPPMSNFTVATAEPARLATASGEPGGPVQTPGTWHSSSSLGSVLMSGPSHYETISIQSRDLSDIDKQGTAQEPPLEEHRREDGLNGYVLSMRTSPNSIRGVMVKERYVGQTHWLHSAVLFPNAIYWFDQQERQKSNCWQILQDCKSLAKLIKLRRSPQPWTGSCGRFLPTRALADQLISNYLLTFETVYRVLHVPTFREEYDRFWGDPKEASPATTIKIQLCLAIGASFYEKQFSLRTEALQWIHEASSWLATSEKLHFSISGLQIMCLVQVARLTVEAFSGDQVWVLGGTILRTATSMGLHLDPWTLPKMSVLRAEIRRRLWATVIELSLAASVEAGVPPQLSREDSNCRPPSNLNDVQLSADTDTNTVPASSNLFTDTSLQICLGRSFSTRLAIVNISNRPLSSPTAYEEILELSSELTACCRSLAASISSFGPAVSDFQKRLCEMLTQRYFLLLHLRYTPLAIAQPLYYFSRKMCVETALRLLYPVLQTSSDGDPILSSLHAAVNVEPKCQEFQLLMICGSGPFRSIPFQCIMSIASELLAVLQEALPNLSQFRAADVPQPPITTWSGSGVSLRNLELHLILRAAVAWMEKRMLAGETNVKDYLFVSMILAHAEALERALSPDQAMQERAAEALTNAVGILRKWNDSEINTWDPPLAEDEEMGTINDFWTSGCAELGYDDLISIVSATAE